MIILTEADRKVFEGVAESFYKHTNMANVTGTPWEKLDSFNRDGVVAGLKGLYDMYRRACIKGFNNGLEEDKRRRKKKETTVILKGDEDVEEIRTCERNLLDDRSPTESSRSRPLHEGGAH